MVDKNTILIVGAPRSGTTLLSGLLTGNNKCFPNLPECTFLTQIIEHYFAILNYSDKERYRVFAKDIDTLQGVYENHINNMVSIIESQFKAQEYSHLVLKDPELTKYIDLIPIFFGINSKVVLIVRDPRDTVSSMIKVELKKEEYNSKLDDDVVSKVAKYIYNYYYIAHQSDLYKSKNILVIKYEDIVDKKEKVFLKLEKFIGYKISRKPFERNVFSFDTKDPTYSVNYDKDIIKVSSEFKEYLSDNNIKFIEAMFSGYNLQYDWW